MPHTMLQCTLVQALQRAECPRQVLRRQVRALQRAECSGQALSAGLGGPAGLTAWSKACCAGKVRALQRAEDAKNKSSE